MVYFRLQELIALDEPQPATPTQRGCPALANSAERAQLAKVRLKRPQLRSQVAFSPACMQNSAPQFILSIIYAKWQIFFIY
jgi:hypothetical protein